MIPSVLAAEKDPVPAVEDCRDAAADPVASLDVPMPPAGSDVVAVQSRQAPAPECPMGGSADGLSATGYVNNESQAGGTFAVGSFLASTDERLPASVLHNEIDPSDQNDPLDRTPALTGTTIKNE